MFKLQIINIDNNANNILLTDNLTIEILKIKYNWLLNATVKNCVIGEDTNGLVWYSGDWICGEWENGTWYSGIWHSGIWKNGKWYSYLLDNLMVLSKKFIILERGSGYSEFRSGEWLNGDFYDGTFGYDRDISNKIQSEIIGKSFTSSYWTTGIFYSGIFKNSVWFNGVFYSGDMSNSYWMNGKFYSGTFSQYDWFDGNWYGGDFKQGNWWNGKFDQINNNIKSRFGTDIITTGFNRWDDGTFINGEFHSGLNLDSSGNTIKSLNSDLSYWYNGHFIGGKWYGGHVLRGDFSNVDWYGGIFNTTIGSANYTNCIWNSGNWYNGLWINGTFKKGHFYDGMWLDGIFEYGYLSTNTTENQILSLSSSSTIYVPSVITYDATPIESYLAYGNGRVTDNGGSYILDRGMCWDTVDNDLTTGRTYITGGMFSDGGTMGSFSIKMNNLTQDTKYYYRAYAINQSGIKYGNIVDFQTIMDTSRRIPTVTTLEVSNLSQTSVIFKGCANWNNDPIIEYGFYYDILPYVTGSTTATGITYSGATISGEITFTGETSTLIVNTTYYYVAYAINGQNSPGTKSYGNIMSFNTSNQSPTIPIILGEIINIYETSARVQGNITYNGNSSIIERGVCWSTTTNPTTLDSIVIFSSPDTGFFTVVISGLTSGTTYHARAYAENSYDIGYSNDLEFKTKSVPSVSIYNTTPSTTSVDLTGQITDNGGDIITNYGFYIYNNDDYYPLTNYPSYDLNNGLFHVSITGLTSSTTYIIYAYATNSVGTGNSNEQNISTIIAGSIPTVTCYILNNNVQELNYEIGGNYSLSVSGETIMNDGIFIIGSSYEYLYQVSHPAVENPILNLQTFKSTYNTNTSGITISFTPISSWPESQQIGFEMYLKYSKPQLTILAESSAQAYYPLLWTVKEKSPNDDYFNNGDFYTEASINGTSLLHGKIIEDRGDKFFQIDISNYSYFNLGYPRSLNYPNSKYLFSNDGESFFDPLIIPHNIIGKESYAAWNYYITKWACTLSNTPVPIYMKYVPSIGEYYQGGIVFYVDTINGHGLIAATEEQKNVKWGCVGTLIGASGTTIGTGYQNTQLIINGCSTSGIAARICTEYNGGGYTDWYLPSTDELYQMYCQKDIIGGFVQNLYEYYYSSSELNLAMVQVISFYDGLLTTYKNKDSDCHVRPIRSF